MSARRCVGERLRRAPRAARAVFSPEKLNSSPGRSSMGRGKLKAPGAAVRGELGELRAARVGQPQQLRGLVEGLAGRIVAGLAEQAVARRPRRPPSAACGRRRPGAPRAGKGGGSRLEQRRQQVPLQMMHADRRHAPGVGEAARERRSGEQRADEPGAGGVGDAVEVAAVQSRPPPSARATSGRSRRT